ncbi:MAG TPA: hypothetical protein VKE69_00645 [Planctomycetota bacterium]|nr:hypothetical protein [Planctomycetota bacterium]
MIPRASLAASAALLAIACSSGARVTRELRGEAPATVAVLPIEGTLSPRAREILRRLVGSFVQGRNYAKLEDEAIDARLAAAGYAPWNPKWLPSDADLAKFARSAGADAVVVGDRFDDTRFSAGVFFQRGLTGRLRVVRARDAETIWSADVGSSSSGGLLLGSGQAIRAVSETVEAGSEATFGRLAAGLALDAIDLLPQHPKEMEVRARPVITDLKVKRALELHADGGPLAAGDVVEIEATGTPGARARASIAGRTGDVPLPETAPGVYRGLVPIEPGSGTGSGPAVVVLYDAYGSVSEPRRSTESWTIDSPRLDPPTGVRADAKGRSVRVQWDSIPGAAGYTVVRAVDASPTQLDAGIATELVDEVPAGARDVFYVVAARSASRRFGPTSAPVHVAVE